MHRYKHNLNQPTASTVVLVHQRPQLSCEVVEWVMYDFHLGVEELKAYVCFGISPPSFSVLSLVVHLVEWAVLSFSGFDVALPWPVFEVLDLCTVSRVKQNKWSNCVALQHELLSDLDRADVSGAQWCCPHLALFLGISICSCPSESHIHIHTRVRTC